MAGTGGGVEEETLPAGDYAPFFVTAEGGDVAGGTSCAARTADASLNVAIVIANLSIAGQDETAVAAEAGGGCGTELAVGDGTDGHAGV